MNIHLALIRSSLVPNLCAAAIAAVLAGCSAARHAPSPGAAPPDATAGIEWVAIPHLASDRGTLEFSRHEVTNAQFQRFIEATGYDGSDYPSSKPGEEFLRTWVDGRHPAGGGDHPVCDVNWHHAVAYCAWLSLETGCTVRLPTDAEWLAAAAGPEGRAYPWGAAWDATRCNWGDGGTQDGFREAAPVGSFPRGATPDGLLDMAGNIWEWTAEKHLRGGPWCERVEWQRCDFVAAEDPLRADDKFGFRVVMEVDR